MVTGQRANPLPITRRAETQQTKAKGFLEFTRCTRVRARAVTAHSCADWHIAHTSFDQAAVTRIDFHYARKKPLSDVVVTC